MPKQESYEEHSGSEDVDDNDSSIQEEARINFSQIRVGDYNSAKWSQYQVEMHVQDLISQIEYVYFSIKYLMFVFNRSYLTDSREESKLNTKTNFEIEKDQ